MKPQHTFRVGGVPEHFNLPWHLALENGDFQASGVKVSYTDFPGGTGAMTKALREKELDIAIVLTEGIVADILKGNPSKIVKVYVRSPLVWGIHVAENSDLHEIEEMRGKRYAISRFGSGSNLMAIVDADQRGWDPKEMQFVKVGNLKGAREALPKGEADVFFWEKFMTQPYVDNGEFRRIGERSTPWPCFMVAVRQEILDQYPEEIRILLEVINHTCDQLMGNPDAVAMISDRYELKIEDVKEWFGITRWGVDFEMPYLALARAIAAVQGLGIVGDEEATPEDVWQHLL